MPQEVDLRNYAIVDFEIHNNAFFNDGLQMGKPSDTSWSLAGKYLLCDIRKNKADAVALLSLDSRVTPTPAQTLVIDDATARVFHFWVDDHVIRDHLSPVDPAVARSGVYFYDVIMGDIATGERDFMITGKIVVKQGVTKQD